MGFKWGFRLSAEFCPVLTHYDARFVWWWSGRLNVAPVALSIISEFLFHLFMLFLPAALLQ